jgi:excisionase family DNA binding protein
MFGTEVLTLQEAAAILKCHPKTLRLMAMEGKIPSRRVGRLWRFNLAKIKKWLNGEDE